MEQPHHQTAQISNSKGWLKITEKSLGLRLPTLSVGIPMSTLIDNSKGGGLRLHKFVSNVKEVIQHVQQEDIASDLKEVDIVTEKLTIERALGIHWCIESNTFQFRIVMEDHPLTRRGILSCVCSMYDPLGFIASVVLTG